LDALRQLGVNHYRFSVEWARIEPKPGVINHAAIAEYVRRARALKEAGIEPIVTLWHFTFPAWLYHEGDARRANYLDLRILPAWRAHVTRMVRALRPYVRIYVPENEPNGQLQLAYLGGHFPPGKLLGLASYKKAMRVSVAMFRDAAEIIRRERPDALVMGIYALPHWRRNWMQDPTGAVFNTMTRLNFDHLDQVHDVCDLIGVNYYFVQDADLVRFLTRRGEIGWKYTQLGWEIDAEGLYDVLNKTYQRYGRPLVITENGLATISEQKKIRYLREHINQMRRAIADGIDVRGYFPWTLVDNYEWREGWRASFGLAYLQAGDRQLTLGTSGKWFADFVRSHPQP
jgi:beta-glucosidase